MFLTLYVSVEYDEYEVGVDVTFYEDRFDFTVDEYSKNEEPWETGPGTDELQNAVRDYIEANDFELRWQAIEDARERARDAHFGL